MAELNQIARALRKIQPTMLQLASATGSGYEEEWSIKLQPGMTYHSIELETNLKEIPTIKRVTLDIGGTPVCYASNVMMNLIDDLYQKQQAASSSIFLSLNIVALRVSTKRNWLLA